jgi:hypothetical protein
MSCKQKSKNQDEVPETLAVHGGYILKNPADVEVMMFEMSQEKWS